MGSRACIAMYPFEGIRNAYQQLWAVVHRHAPWTPEHLTWTDNADAVDLPSTWMDPHCVVGQACGWPVATTLAPHVQVIGALQYAVPEAVGHRYRTMIMAARPGDLADFADAPAAANSPDSLSGWISLTVALHGVGATLDHPVTFTGAHVHSLRLLQEGEAAVASIDPVTLAHVRRLFPHLVEGLHLIGHGPLVPSVPLITPATTSPDQLAELRAAFAAAVADPGLRPALETLLIEAFVPLGNDAYEECLALVTLG